jgi:predicted ATPase
LFEDDNLTFSATVAEHGGPHRSVRRIEYGFAGHVFTLAFEQADGGYRLSQSGSTGFQLKRAPSRPWLLPPPVKCYGFPDQVYSYYQNAGFLADFPLALEQQFAKVYYLGPLRELPRAHYPWYGDQPVDVGRSGEKAVEAILAARKRNVRISRGRGRSKETLEECVAGWLRNLGLVHSFEVKPISEGERIFEVHVRKGAKATSVRLTDVGFGVSQILPVIVLCYYVPEGSTIVFEQPEIHLHPAVQAGLADLFIDAVRFRNIQLIIESHSEHLLRRLQRRMAEADKLTNEDVALYFCRHDGIESKLDPLDVDRFGNIRNWPEDFFGNEFEDMAKTTLAAMRRMDKLAKTQ